MRIAVIGAGVLGSLYAAKLVAAGQTVTLVARGDRLTQLQRGPILILNEDDGVSAAAKVEVAANLDPDAAYTLALVAELFAIVRFEPGAAPDLETLWAAVSAAANRGNLSGPARQPEPISANP